MAQAAFFCFEKTDAQQRGEEEVEYEHYCNGLERLLSSILPQKHYWLRQKRLLWLLPPFKNLSLIRLDIVLRLQLGPFMKSFKVFQLA